MQQVRKCWGCVLTNQVTGLPGHFATNQQHANRADFTPVIVCFDSDWPLLRDNLEIRFV